MKTLMKYMTSKILEVDKDNEAEVQLEERRRDEQQSARQKNRKMWAKHAEIQKHLHLGQMRLGLQMDSSRGPFDSDWKIEYLVFLYGKLMVNSFLLLNLTTATTIIT